MAATYLGERAEDRERTVTADEVRYRRMFLVRTDDSSDGPLRVSQVTQIPRMGAFYQVKRSNGTVTEVDQSCLVIERRAQPVSGSHQLWAVEVIYSNKADANDNSDDDDDVEQETPAVHFGFETKLVAFTADVDPVSQNPLKPGVGVGAVSTAGEPFDPPPEYEVDRPILTVTLNQLVLNFGVIRAYQAKVNSDAYLGAPPNTLRVRIEADRVYKNGFRYWRVTYTFVYEETNWWIKVLNQGTFYIDHADGNKRKRFVTDDEPPQPRLGLLAEDGDALHDADPPWYVFLKPYRQLPFNVLLPANIIAIDL